MFMRIKSVVLGVAIIGGSLMVPKGVFAAIGAEEIYKQASLDNQYYLNVLKRYGRVIDVVDVNGNTAYCLAYKNKDKQAMKLLAQNGADVNHRCMENIATKQKNVKKERKLAQKRRAPRFRADNDTSSYLLMGLGGAAVVGGAVAIAGGGGGGGKGSSGSSAGGYSDEVYDGDGTAEGFRTKEYKKGNFLDSINAANAYSKMYSQKDGVLVSHQANDLNKKLEKVRVGVIDSGIRANADIKNKIVGGYDINKYNSQADIYGYDAGDVELYFYKNNGVYYPIVFNSLTDTVEYFKLKDEKGNNVNITSTNISNFFDHVKKYYNVSVKLSDFEVMNSGNGYAPGIGNITGNGWDVAFNKASYLSHGTHIAGIIAGSKNDQGMHGVAFENAELVVASWDLETNIDETVKKMVADGVKVFNNSWNSDVDSQGNRIDIDDVKRLPYMDLDGVKAYAYAAKNKAVWVQATGNEGRSQPSIYSGLGNLDLKDYGYSGPGKYEVPYLAVTALDQTKIRNDAPMGIIASYSNYCGKAQNWCIAAPGTFIESSLGLKDGTGAMSGTSMATPVVSGSIALLKGYYPWLNAQNIAYILLETANDEGEYADASIYGQGALDLGAAVSTPIGDLGLPQGQNLDNVISARGSKLYASSVMQNKLLKSMPKTITAYDALKRPFKYDTKKLIDTTHSTSANLKNAVSRLALGDSGKKVIKDEKTGFAFSSVEGLDSKGNKHLTTAEVVRETEDGATRFYYAENSKYMDVDEALVNSSNPYFNMREAYGAENTMNLSDSSRLKLSLQAGENGLYERDEDLDKHSFDERSYAMGAEYSFNLTDYLELSTLGGMLFEEDAMLGLNGVGGLGLSDSSTYYMGVKAKLDLTSNISLLLAYYRGYTSGSDSALMSISDLETESFMIASEYSFNQNDKIGLMLSSPMSVVKGTSSFLYSNGRDNNSNRAYLSKLKTSLRPEAKEYDLGIYFKSKPQEDLALSGKVEARFNADGQKGVVDYLGVVGAQYSF